jgi:hypothetical protein
MAERLFDLREVAAELDRRAPGLHVEIVRDGRVQALEARTPLIPQGVARVHVAYRPDGYNMMALEPIDRGMGATAHLRSPDASRIADAIAEWATRPLRVVLPRPPGPDELRRRVLNRLKLALADAAVPPPLDASGIAENLDPALVAFHYPRDRRGRMQGTARVLIGVLERGAPGRRSRCLFVRLHDGAFETFISDEFVENQDHRWHLQTWRWDRLAAHAPAPERWGVDDVDAAIRSTELLESGRFHEGLEQFGVQVCEQLRKVLAGEPLGPLHVDLAAKWGTVAAEQLAAAAPWRLGAVATKNWTRVFGLGGSNAQVKPVVALGLRDGRPALEVTALGSNRRLAAEDWQRSNDFEAYRLGIVGYPAHSTQVVPASRKSPQEKP